MLTEDSCTYLFSGFVPSFDLPEQSVQLQPIKAVLHHKLTMRLNWDSLLGLFSKWPESGHLHCVVVVNDEAAVTKDETRRVSRIHGHTHCASHRDVRSLIVSMCE